MSDKLLTGLGAAAIAVATVALVALIFSVFDSGGDTPAARATAAKGPARSHPAAGRQDAKANTPRSSRPATPAPPPTPSPAASQAVPALPERPARGPAFEIARLRANSQVTLWDEPHGNPVEKLGTKTEFGSPVVFSVVRTVPGWLGVASPDRPNGSLGWIRRDPTRVEVYWTKYSLHADLSSLRLTLLYGKARLGRFLVTVGATGTETPTGRFGITDALSFDESPYYGCCALALSGRQEQLPPNWIGGDRLAIHGTPGPVGAAESHGCIRATDAVMRELFRRVPLGAPVFVDE